MKWTVLILASGGALISSAHGIASPYSPDASTLALIAREIEDLKEKYPQLKEFSPQGNLNIQALTISYEYRTHKAKHPGGWTAGVPNPDENGIWFYVDFHDPASASQIHTQPASIVRHCLGDKRVGFLILEGSKTTSVNGAIWQVLRKYGVAECPQQVRAVTVFSQAEQTSQALELSFEPSVFQSKDKMVSSWKAIAADQRDMIEEYLFSLGLSSTGVIQLIGVYRNDASPALLHFQQLDLHGTRLFWSVLVNPGDMTARVIYHTQHNRISDSFAPISSEPEE